MEQLLVLMWRKSSDQCKDGKPCFRVNVEVYEIFCYPCVFQYNWVV